MVCWGTVGYRENLLGKPLLKGWGVAELPEELGVIGEKFDDGSLQRFVVFDASVISPGVLHRILVSLI
jgi:hypothetical protein